MKTKIGKYKLIRRQNKNKTCSNCENNYIFAIPFLNLYLENCKEKHEPSLNCKWFKERRLNVSDR